MDDINFTLRIKGGDAALEEGGTAELTRIIREVADRIERGEDSGKVFDVNGNRVGSFDVY